MASASGTMKYLTTPLTPFLNRGLEFAKLRAQERNVRLSERQRIGRDGCVQAVLARFLALAERLRPFCVTKPDHAALAIAVGKGIDPLTMTSQQAAALSPSQRKALAGIKARYQRAKK